jgi:hypothetical protein
MKNRKNVQKIRIIKHQLGIKTALCYKFNLF